MDPNVTLTMIFDYLARASVHEANDEAGEALHDYTIASELFYALDEWLGAGSGLPEAWHPFKFHKPTEIKTAPPDRGGHDGPWRA